MAALLKTAARPNSAETLKLALKTDFYHFLLNFNCPFVNKAYAKKRKIFFTFTFTPRKEKDMARNTARNALWLDL